MEIEQLFQGPGLVIDDKVFNRSGDSIIRIVDFLESKGIPLAKYDSVLDFKGCNCRKFSFVLLDWELVSVVDEMGIPIPGASEASKTAKRSLVSFLKELLDKCYIPIFIFSNDSPRNIEKELRKEKIDLKTMQPPILIRQKADLVTDQGVLVMDAIREWIDKMPSMYVLKKWENAIDCAKTETFKSLASTHSWPQIMWRSAHKDHVNESEEILELLSQNVFGRLPEITIEKEQLDKDDAEEPNKDALLNVLSVQRFNGRIHKDVSTTGDFYKIGSHYYVNVRPACDCVARGDDTDVYLIQAQQMTNKAVKDDYINDYGNFREQNNEAVLGPICGKRFFKFFFHSTRIFKYDDVKDTKIGRILPPFIRHITERYGLYIQRQGLPRVPREAIFSPEEIANLQVGEDTRDESG